MHYETLWNGVEVMVREDRFPLSTDSVLCAHFARLPHHAKAADLGCGSGAIAMMLLASDPTLHMTGIELDREAAEAARENARHNGVDLTVLHGDLRQIRDLLPAGSMDACVSNPPYFPAGSGPRASGALAAARSEETCSLTDLCAAAGWLLKTGGRMTLVHRPERLADLCCALRQQQLEPKRLCFVRHRSNAPISLILMEAVKGGHPGLSYEPELILFEPDGTETAACKAAYHRT